MRTACVAAVSIVGNRLSADPIEIISINTSGDLVWVNTNMANGTYRVEYKNDLDEV